MMTGIKFRALIMAICSVFILSACASSYTMNNNERTEAYAEYIVTEKLESMDRVRSFRLDGFSSLSDENLIISTGVNRSYLITFRNTCFNLRQANFIKVNNSDSSLQTKFDSISVPQDAGIGTKCFIDKIHKLTVEQKKAMLKIGRKSEEDKG
ncbi:MAG: hypothetical protein ACI9IA_000845 [Enterobacterales bacterium]|jgi:hypothetical protein